MKKKPNKIKRYTFSDKVRDLRNKTLNYGIKLIFALVLAIPFLLYFGSVNLCGIDIVLVLVTMLVMAVIELLHAVINRKEYIEVESQLNAISKANKQQLNHLCSCNKQPPTYNTIASKT